MWIKSERFTNAAAAPGSLAICAAPRPWSAGRPPCVADIVERIVSPPAANVVPLRS